MFLNNNPPDCAGRIIISLIFTALPQYDNMPVYNAVPVPVERAGVQQPV